ncbi:P-loop containing nucleoside triphosphate hydrolase protein [Tribonema minus]|uniref:P-loop containing nucleoside triphosphate hydrolase protein n=1 Tax=Tribonema minus TaxID=303371 RepID=A0A836CK00_9STRA|nr:P-loop containing nucleoside triphosphate hydrolase protein [Tribonema minus]
MMTKDVQPTAGDIFVEGRNVLGDAGWSGGSFPLGYCPQVDPLLDLMTARETLMLYAGLRGIPKGPELNAAVAATLSQVGLQEYADRRAGTLSGGSKRKLSLAIALTGQPAVALLDEPSCGMDPVSKRRMWNVIAGLRSSGRTRSIVLTTHSMEECEALCTRVGIMRDGQLRCLGSCQHLKSRFGGSYSIELQFKEGFAEGVKALVPELSRDAVLEEEHETSVKYSVPARSQLSLADAFGTIEARRQELEIVTYSISQSSLEQIFVGIAKDGGEGDTT